MGALHQIVAGYSLGDAISNEARVLRRIFRGWGRESEIFSEAACIHPELRRDASDVRACRVDPDDVVLLHLSMGSEVNEVFARLRCRKAILYHNITPPEYFTLYQPRTAEHLRRGRAQMNALAGVAGVNLAVSRFNASELEAAGYTGIGVLPILLDFDALDGRPDPKILDAYRDDRTTILFVGRCAPNKCIDDLVRMAACFQRNVDPLCRFIHVGSFTGMEAYHGMCRVQARNLGLERMHFMGSVTPAQLAAFYRCADLFLSASEHEGFCIPLLEAMHFRIPILAYAAGAVPETLDGAGVLYHQKDLPAVAEMMGRLTRDGAVRDAVRAAQDRRLAAYHTSDLATKLREYLAPIL